MSFSKLLANRIVKFLDSIILVTQTGFIKGRFILENLVTSWEAMHWAKADNQNSSMILLDFEKAYDRIEWHFVIAVIKQFGFLDFFVNGSRSCSRILILVQRLMVKYLNLFHQGDLLGRDALWPLPYMLLLWML